MDWFVSVGVALIGMGAWRILRWVEVGNHGELRCLSLTGVGAEAGAWSAAGGFFMFLPLPETRPLSLWLLVSLPVLMFVARVSRRVREGVVSTASPSTWAFVRTRAAEGLQRTRRIIARFWAIVAPSGWGEVRIGFGAIERMLEPMTIVRSYFVLLILLPVIVAVSVIWSLNSGDSLQRGVTGVFVGYNALAWVSFLTAATLITLILSALLRVAGVVNVRPDHRGVFITIAQGVGFGTAAGLVAGALLPFMLGVIPYAASESSIGPAMLVDIPAAWGVAGYVLGILVATAGIFRNAENLLIRNLAGPAIFGGVIWVMSLTDSGPRRILANVLASSHDSEIDCTESGLEAHVDDPEWLFRALSDCGGEVLLAPERTLLWILTSTLVLVVVTFFVRDVYRAGAGARAAD